MSANIRLVRKIENGDFVFQVYFNGEFVPPEKYSELSCLLTGCNATAFNGIFTQGQQGQKVYFKYKKIGEVVDLGNTIDFFREDCQTIATKLQQRIQRVRDWINTLNDYYDESSFTIQLPPRS